MSSVKIVWKEPPPPKTGNDAVLVELKANPGRWALLAEGKASSGMGTPWRKLGCETRTVRTNPGDAKPRYDLYVRWPAQKSLGNLSVPRPAPRPAPDPAAVQRATQEATAFARDRAARGVPETGKPVETLHRP
jgi:hypothetical protein